MVIAKHLTLPELEAGLDHIRQSPKDAGVLEMIVRRPAVDRREVLEVAELDVADGLAGDTWRARGSATTPDGAAHPDMQIAIMNARFIELVAQGRDRWPLAGDQLFIDIDLSVENLPPGARLAAGPAVLEITAEAHNGCVKFSSRYGTDALKFVSSRVGRELRLRGVYAKVVRGGTIRAGDVAKKR